MKKKELNEGTHLSLIFVLSISTMDCTRFCVLIFIIIYIFILFLSPPQPSFFVTANSVRKSTRNRQGRLSVTVTVRDKPSGKKRHGKSVAKPPVRKVFPDGKQNVSDSFRLFPSAASLSAKF